MVGEILEMSTEADREAAVDFRALILTWSHCHPFTLSSAIATLSCLLVLSGCGDGAERIRVSGQVTFDGKAVQYGNIIFEPDQSRGNHGPQGYAKIKHGHYDTSDAGTGPCPGPQVVYLEGYPELDISGPKKSRLVFNHRTAVDLPAQATTVDFAVPATAARWESVSDLPPP